MPRPEFPRPIVLRVYVEAPGSGFHGPLRCCTILADGRECGRPLTSSVKGDPVVSLRPEVPVVSWPGHVAASGVFGHVGSHVVRCWSCLRFTEFVPLRALPQVKAELGAMAARGALVKLGADAYIVEVAAE